MTSAEKKDEKPTGSSPSAGGAGEDSDKSSGKRHVRVMGPLWNRYDPETNKVTVHMRGSTLHCTEQEFEMLSTGAAPAIKEVEQEEDD